MLVDQADVRQVLRRIAYRLSRCGEEEDTLQEALIHLWHEEEHHPGHSRSWYLQNCALFLHNHSRLGRSIDSPKRTPERTHWQEIPAGAREVIVESRVFEVTSARDLLSTLWPRLTAPDRLIIARLAEGWSVRECARFLHLSHTDVIKHRRRIARMARALGIDPPPRLLRGCETPIAKIRLPIGLLIYLYLIGQGQSTSAG